MKTLPLRFAPQIALVGILALNACADQSNSLGPQKLASSQPSRLTVPLIGSYTQMSYPCAVRNDGVVRCWSAGQITLEKAAATGVFTKVAPGGHHGCALRSDGIVECWGRNTEGQAPPVVSPPTGMLFVDLDAGAFFSCALRNDGVIQCWGWNQFGEAAPTLAPTSGLFQSVAAANADTCGITSFGVIECFGNRGHRTFSPSSGSFTKIVTVHELCGIRTGGAVECRQVPPTDTRVPMPGAFLAFTTTGSSQCGITLAGVIQCIGDYSYSGQTPTTITASSGTFTDLVLGDGFLCALRSDGAVDCSGLFVPPFGAFEQLPPTATFTAPASVIVGQPIPLALSNAQVPGYPLETVFTYAFDCGSGSFSPTEPGPQSTATCPTSATGTRVVRGKVADREHDETIYSATVTIKSAQQGATDLRTEIQLAPLSPDIRKALATKLESALSAIAKGKTSAACSALKDFINQVNAQKGKAIPIETADSWILTAQQLQAAIGC